MSVWRCTTVELLATEAELVQVAERAALTATAVVDPAAIADALAARPMLTGDQADLVASICAARSSAACVIGKAGTGKAFALGAARAAWENADAIVAVEKTKGKSGCSQLLALLLLAGFAGLRPGELLALRRNAINLLHQLVAVDENAPEVGGRRIIGRAKSEAGTGQVAISLPIMHDIEAHLDQFVGPEPDARLFIGPRGPPLGENYLSVCFRKAVEEVPGPPRVLRVCDLRHHAAAHRPGPRRDQEGAHGLHRPLFASRHFDLPARHRGTRQADRPTP
jgi:hypothetical protein